MKYCSTFKLSNYFSYWCEPNTSLKMIDTDFLNSNLYTSKAKVHEKLKDLSYFGKTSNKV